jgi:hypothetical protein
MLRAQILNSIHRIEVSVDRNTEVQVLLKGKRQAVIVTAKSRLSGGKNDGFVTLPGINSSLFATTTTTSS